MASVLGAGLGPTAGGESALITPDSFDAFNALIFVFDPL
jgi:hypothetical protein